VLPLTVTCAPDDRFAAAVRAVVGRVGGVANERATTQPFVDAVEAVVTWAFAHPDGIDGDIALQFAREGDRLQGELRWQAAAAGVAVPPSTSSLGVEVTCGVDGAAVHCRITCRCA